MAAALDLLKDVAGLEALLGEKAPPRVPSFRDNFLFDSEAERERKARHIASKPAFYVFVFLCIVASSIIYGIELDMNVGANVEDRYGFFLADAFFLTAFLAEMALRQHKLGWEYFRASWNIIDYALVVTNVLDFVATLDPVQNNRTRIASVLRLVRLLRVAGQLEGIKAFKGMWLVLEGLVQSARSVFWTGIFICVILYGLGIVLSTSIAEQAIVFERWNDANVYLGSVPRCIFTTLQVFTYDGWISAIVRPLLELEVPETAFIFITIVVICNFGVMNMIIALMIERLQAMKKATQKLKRVDDRLWDALAADFATFDDDEGGSLDREELNNFIASPDVNYKLRLLGVHRAEASVLFDLLDVDKNGLITPQEFFKGMMRIRGEAKSADVLKLVSTAMKFKQKASKNLQRVQAISARIDGIQARLNALGFALTGEVNQRTQDAERQKEVWDRAALRQKVVDEAERQQRLTFPSLRDSAAESELSSLEEHIISEIFPDGKPRRMRVSGQLS